MTAPGKSVTKRDEIARELAKEFPPKTWTEFGYVYTDTEIWQALVDARTRLAEREAASMQLKELAVEAQRAFNREPTSLQAERAIRKLIGDVLALAVPRKEPRNGN